MTKILICGGRNLSHIKVCEWLQVNFVNMFPLAHEIIHGDNPRGGDAGAAMFANMMVGKLLHTRCPADWDKYDKAAGMIRNKMMRDVHKPDAVLAFPGGRGTDNMIKLAMEKHIICYTFTDKDAFNWPVAPPSFKGL